MKWTTVDKTLYYCDVVKGNHCAIYVQFVLVLRDYSDFHLNQAFMHVHIFVSHKCCGRRVHVSTHTYKPVETCYDLK